MEKPVTRASIRQVTEFAGAGCALQALGLMAPIVGLIGGLIGFLIGCLVCVVMIIAGSSRSFRWTCGHCGNDVVHKTVKICPHCHARLSWTVPLQSHMLGWVVVAVVAGAIFFWYHFERHLDTATSPTRIVRTAPALTGWTLPEVVSRHGEPVSKDATTGWAQWADFAARFEGGAVVEVR